MSEEKKKFGDLAVLGINLAVFAAYTLLGLYNNADGWFVISLWHAAACVVMALVQRRWIWVLAGVLILVIGCATCANNFHLDTK
nr:hypothetical protein [Mucilaginibacter sp. L294]